MEESQNYNEQGIGSLNNNAYYQTATALQIRLDTSPVIEQIEMYLKGAREELRENDKGEQYKTLVAVGKPLLSDEGIQWIMNFVGTIFNPQVVQGNFQNYDQYAEYIYRCRMDLADHLMKNFYDYDIRENNYNGIISTLMRFIEAFMSRLIGNKERDSYSNTIRTSENNTITPQKQGFKLPFTQ